MTQPSMTQADLQAAIAQLDFFSLNRGQKQRPHMSGFAGHFRSLQ
jgi:hypothetical protein